MYEYMYMYDTAYSACTTRGSPFEQRGGRIRLSTSQFRPDHPYSTEHRIEENTESGM